MSSTAFGLGMCLLVGVTMLGIMTVAVLTGQKREAIVSGVSGAIILLAPLIQMVI